MNPSLLGAAAATLLVALWLVRGRQPRPFLRSADTSAVAALNRAQIERVITAAPPLAPATTPSPPPSGLPPAAALLAAHPIPARGDQRSRGLLLRRLDAASGRSLPERLAALRLARRWGHPATLPLLRRGLRDVHPAVVREAALALEAYRGRRLPSATLSLPVRSPRTVARTR
jgi:hypothetical protein